MLIFIGAVCSLTAVACLLIDGAFDYACWFAAFGVLDLTGK